MKIYFAGSIRGGRQDALVYAQILKYLQTKGQVLTEHVGDDKVTESGEMELSEKEIFDRDIKWLKESDVVIAEVTIPSLGVGFEVAEALCKGKKTLCIHRLDGKQLSAMIEGSSAEKAKYKTLEEAKAAIDAFLDKV